MPFSDLPPELLARELVALATKYATMSAFRSAAVGALTHGDLRALSSLFPGALAEIDRIDDALLEDRRVASAALAARARVEGEAAADEVPTWALAWIATHRALRGALAIKRRLRGERTLDEARKRELRDAIAANGKPEEALWRDELDVVATPPGGRLLDVVLDRVARELGLDGDMRALLMPRPRVSDTRSL